MPNSEWKKGDFKQFVDDFGIDIIINNAPKILYSKKDKEHEPYELLRTFFIIMGGLLVYIAISLIIIDIFFSLFLFVLVILIILAIDTLPFFYYLKSRVFIRPIDCWVEIYKQSDFYCFSYYIVFSGKCHPNKAKNLVYKLYQEEVLKSSIDITQIEVYLKINQDNKKNITLLGYFFEYGKGKPFKYEIIDRDSWQFFPSETSKNDNYLAIANWEHQYEWRNELEHDLNKEFEYAPWLLTVWDKMNIYPLIDEYKNEINWKLRYIDSIPKLKPWKGELENQNYENQNANNETEIIEEAIKIVIGEEYRVVKEKDLKLDLFKLKSHFRDLEI